MSACGVPDAAHSPSIALNTTSRGDNGRPSISFAATAPAALLAPELPSPLASGICLCNHKRSPFALARAPQHVGRGAAGDILHRVAAQPPAVSGDLDDLDAGRVRELGIEQIARAAQCQTEHVETWPDIGNGGRCEHANSLIFHGFADYRITIPPCRGMEWNSERE